MGVYRCQPPAVCFSMFSLQVALQRSAEISLGHEILQARGSNSIHRGTPVWRTLILKVTLKLYSALTGFTARRNGSRFLSISVIIQKRWPKQLAQNEHEPSNHMVIHLGMIVFTTRRGRTKNELNVTGIR